MSLKQKVLSILGIVVIISIVLFSPYESSNGDFTKVLKSLGYHQEETANNITTYAVHDVEGNLVGEHQVDGSNWAIPNIIRHRAGVNS